MAEKIVPAADKTIKIIEFMAQDPGKKFGITEIASALSFNKGTVYSILQTLIENQWVDKNFNNNHYGLSNRLMILAQNFEKSNTLITDFMLVAAALERTCGELINLHIAQSITTITLVASVPSTTHNLRVDFPIGSTIPVHISSAGKCIVSEYDDDTLGHIFSQCHYQYTSSTIRSAENFIQEIHSVHQNGYAVNQAEYEEGIYSVAAPVRGARGNIIAAINIVIPKVRLNTERMEELIHLVKKGAGQLSKIQGWKSGEKISET